MIPSLAIALAAPASAQQEEQAPEAEETTEEAPLSRYRTQFDVLAERAIGTASRPVEFNWRHTKVQLAVTGSYLVELNNFNSMRAGGIVRLPSGGTIVELGVTYAGVWDSPSSRALAYTPYRQPGRPNRLELDVTLGLPLAEGVVTTFPRFFPAVQMVFNAYGSFRYNVYPTGYGHMKPGELFGALLSPTLTETELENLDDARLDAMQIDLGRYGLMGGLGNDLYFKSGFFLSPRLMLGIPLLEPATDTDLLIWADLSLSIGLAL